MGFLYYWQNSSGCIERGMMNAEEKLGKVKLALLTMQRYSWEQGVAAQAFLEAEDYETMILLAKDAVNRQVENGQLALMRHDEAYDDPAACGEAVLLAAQLTNDTRLSIAADRMLKYILEISPKTQDGIVLHMGQQVWIDAMYMTPPFLAAAGKSAEAIRQIEGFRSRLYDPGKRLYSHMWDEGKMEFARRDFWGVGNGWTAAGLTRVIQLLPEALVDDRSRLIGYVQELLDASLDYMRPDGLFHDVIDDPATFIETNFAQMMAYTIFRGVKAGWLNQEYVGRAEKMYHAALAKVDHFGLVQDVCGSPEFDHPGTAPEGQAFFILMESARRKLMNKLRSTYE
jgi:unsaturated rhamnogalacturonyl hydrolase